MAWDGSQCCEETQDAGKSFADARGAHSTYFNLLMDAA